MDAKLKDKKKKKKKKKEKSSVRRRRQTKECGPKLYRKRQRANSRVE